MYKKVQHSQQQKPKITTKP